MTQLRSQCIHDGMWNEFCEICAIFLQSGGRGKLKCKGRQADRKPVWFCYGRRLLRGPSSEVARPTWPQAMLSLQHTTYYYLFCHTTDPPFLTRLNDFIHKVN